MMECSKDNGECKYLCGGALISENKVLTGELQSLVLMLS